jgi:adhesin/invasin
MLALALAACGGGGGDPTPPGATPASISVTVNNQAAMTAFGQTRTLTAVVRDANQQVIPNATVSWARDVNDKVTLSSNTGLTTMATATANGSVDITATSGSVTSTPVRLVVDQVLDEVSVSPNPQIVLVGRQRNISVSARDANDQVIGYSYQAQFSSGNEGIATVAATSTNSAAVTGVANGQTAVTATVTVQGVTKEATATINVQPAVTSADVVATSATTFDPSRVDIVAGGTVRWAWSSLAHNVTFESQGAPANIGGQNTAASDPDGETREFPTAGQYNYHCGIHPTMTGTVVVH